MSNKLTKIMAVYVALVMLVSGVSICIAGHNPSTKSVSFDDSLPAENLTASPCY